VIRKARLIACGVSFCALVMLLTPALNGQSVVLENLPYSGGVLMARAIQQGRVQIHSGVSDLLGIPPVTCSPVPCVFTPDRASEGGQPVNEDPIAVNPTNSQNLLSGGNDYNCANIQGFFSSSDGGTTWSHVCLSGSGGEGDPIVGFDLNGKAYAGGIQNGDYVLASSTDGGLTFGTPVIVSTPLLGSGGLADKPWLEVDVNAASPFKNALYVSGTQFSSGSNSEISVSHSTDGGLTWTTKVVDTEQIYPTEVDQFSDLAIGKDGTVYLNWLRCPANGPTGNCGDTVSDIMFSKSTDGGNTWSTASVVTTVKLMPDPSGAGFYGTLPHFNSERISDIPSNAVLGVGATARVYVAVYTWTGTVAEVEVIKSTNGGSSWGAPVVVSAPTTGDQFFQWINVGGGGRAAVTWLDRRNDTADKLYQPFYALSTPTGYSPATALSAAKSNPAKDGFGGSFIGDYRTHVWSGGTVYAVWMDTTTGTNNSQDEFGGVKLH
jgi:hypothetical protein